MRRHDTIYEQDPFVRRDLLTILKLKEILTSHLKDLVIAQKGLRRNLIMEVNGKSRSIDERMNYKDITTKG